MTRLYITAYLQVKQLQAAVGMLELNLSTAAVQASLRHIDAYTCTAC
jgi:hypothetical protein